MIAPIHYALAIRRALFIVLLGGLVVLPHVTQTSPRAPFDTIRDLLTLPLWVYLAVGAASLLGLAIRVGLAYRPSAQPENGSGSRNFNLFTMAIEQAVAPAAGGNGLASRASLIDFRLRAVGWIIVQTPKLECVVVENRVFRRSRLLVAPLQLVGKQIYARRVMLKPVLLSLKQVSDLTTGREKWRVQMDVDVIYTLKDPVAAIGEDPLKSFSSQIQGEIAQYIRGKTQDALLQDKGEIGRQLHRTLTSSPVLRGLLIERIVVTAIRGDERVLEIKRDLSLESSRLNLIVVQGQGRVLQAQYSGKIEEMRAQLQEWVDQNVHQRQKALLMASIEGANLQTMIQTVGQIAAAGVDPGKIWSDFQSALAPTPFPIRNSIASGMQSESRLALERRLLEENQHSIGYTQFKLDPHTQFIDRPGRATLNFDLFSLQLECPPDYPQEKPKVALYRASGEQRVLSLSIYDSQGGLVGVIVTSVLMANMHLSPP